jgi:hypothetical protein
MKSTITSMLARRQVFTVRVKSMILRRAFMQSPNLCASPQVTCLLRLLESRNNPLRASRTSWQLGRRTISEMIESRRFASTDSSHALQSSQKGCKCPQTLRKTVSANLPQVKVRSIQALFPKRSRRLPPKTMKPCNHLSSLSTPRSHRKR